MVVFIILVFAIFNEFRVKSNINIPDTEEGFSINNININFCPHDSKEFIDKNDNTLCCAGKINNRTCEGKIICSLSTINSTNNRNTLCGVYYNNYINLQKTRLCPSGWNYYENKKNKGCTKGSVNSIKTEPTNISSLICNIYNSQLENYKNNNSCLNAVELNNFRCLQPGCRKYVDNDGLLYQTYTNDNITKICTNNKRAKEILSSERYKKLKDADQIC